MPSSSATDTPELTSHSSPPPWGKLDSGPKAPDSFSPQQELEPGHQIQSHTSSCLDKPPAARAPEGMDSQPCTPCCRCAHPVHPPPPTGLPAELRMLTGRSGDPISLGVALGSSQSHRGDWSSVKWQGHECNMASSVPPAICPTPHPAGEPGAGIAKSHSSFFFVVEKWENKQQKRSLASFNVKQIQKPQEKAFPLCASLFRPRNANAPR